MSALDPKNVRLADYIMRHLAGENVRRIFLGTGGSGAATRPQDELIAAEGRKRYDR